mmetsp:Transcript_5765/g.13146  ORF Transcript_5765/g.13146 Transcript_5765/m.13146 type:complete len:91 (+) Transcript_5765:255-527(+)
MSQSNIPYWIPLWMHLSEVSQIEASMNMKIDVDDDDVVECRAIAKRPPFGSNDMMVETRIRTRIKAKERSKRIFSSLPFYLSALRCPLLV